LGINLNDNNVVYINDVDIKQLDKEERAATYKPQESGCYIATAVYGSYEAPEVLVSASRRCLDAFMKRLIK